MTRFQVRTGPEQTVDPATDFLLDTFEDRQASTIQYEPDFLKGLDPTPVARDLLRLGGAVYCADKLARRDVTTDFWTRDIRLQVPVSDIATWDAAAELLDGALTFLAGEPWAVEFVEDTAEAQLAEPTPPPDEGACLFSGGLDSLAGAIDLLEAGKRLVLVGHHDSALTDNRQVALHRHLLAHYGPDRVSLRRLLLGPAAPSTA